MRYNYIFFYVLAWVMLSGCNSWLEVEPTDKVDDEKLFSSYNGFRNSLNGIYQVLSSSDLYGRELSWGFVASLEQSYVDNQLGDEYKNVQMYNYEHADVKPVISSIWLKGYRVIANCNKLIEEIQKKDSLFFPQGMLEKNLILGEALAIRGFMHFDITRLFGPAPVMKDGAPYIPYFTDYASKFEKKLPTSEVIELAIADLLKAKDLLAKNDTITNATWGMSRVESRFRPNSNAVGGAFFSCRGIRMNYVAVCGLLARMYLYAGNEAKAHEYALHVYETFKVRKAWYSFTYEWDAVNFVKLYEDLILSFYDRDLLLNISNFKKSHYSSGHLSLKGVDAMFDDRNDQTDYRSKLIQYVSDRPYSKRWYDTGSGEQAVCEQYPLIPVLRMSEIYYILSETYFDKSREKSEWFLTEMRKARSAMRQITGLEKKEDLMEELIWEGKKEYLTEGQMFYMFKRLNHKILSGTQEIEMNHKFIIPTPDNENL